MKNGPYELVIAPEQYPGKKYRNRYCYEHHLVWWQAGNILPQAGEVLHHINNNRRDNRLENLELMSVAQHNTEHSPETVMRIETCAYCNNEFSRPARHFNSKYKNYYCNRRCMGKAQVWTNLHT